MPDVWGQWRYAKKNLSSRIPSVGFELMMSAWYCLTRFNHNPQRHFFPGASFIICQWWRSGKWAWQKKEWRDLPCPR
jgi:hypothetical protein